MKVRDLRPTSRWFTLTVKVLEVGEEKTVFSRRDGSQHRVAEALVGDETGTILFSLWDDDIDRVRDLVGSSITVRNGYIVLFRGSMRLALGRFGTIEEAEREVEKVDETVNMSERKYESRRPPRRRSRRRFT
ncbi:MAG: single-stranded DNA-binding protein [Thermoprotei archaeon]|nr:MAG: single-stranded DNA-binding protein [Thermoprotei archaeon]